MRPRHNIVENAVFVGNTRYRRILAAANGYVLYSNGGETNRECKLTTFRRWIGSQKAVSVNSKSVEEHSA